MKNVIGLQWLAFEALSLFPDMGHIELWSGGSYQSAWAPGCKAVKPVVLHIGPYKWWAYASVDAVSTALAIILKAECWIPA